MTTLTKTATVEVELEALAEQNNGLLLPEKVIDFARNPETALHARFTWDDNAAAHQWRLAQARQVISVFVTIVSPVETPVKTWVSLVPDRYNGGGYRRINDVMTNEEQRRQLLTQARKELALWRAKYQTLRELEPVFVAMETLP